MNKKLFSILFIFSIIAIQNAYSYHFDEYKGRVKYGTYHCIKDGKTCNFERMEGSTTYSGDACPKFVTEKNISTDKFMEERDKFSDEMADFLNSEYCKFTPTKVKKYVCNYDVGYATVFLKDGRVVSASYDPDMPKRDMQDLYEPDKCKLEPMEGDNGEPPLKYNTTVNHNSNTDSKKDYTSDDYDKKDDIKDISDDKYRYNKYKEKDNDETLTEKNFSDDIKEEQEQETVTDKEKSNFDYRIIIIILLIIFLITIYHKDNNPNHKI